MAGTRTTGPLAGGLAAFLLAAPAAWAADIPRDKSTKATITPGPARFEGVLERQGDSDWYRITLKAGRNYALVGELLRHEGRPAQRGRQGAQDVGPRQRQRGRR